MGAVARPFVFAWHFLTAVPLSHVHHDPTNKELAASMAWFPVIGLLIGGMLAGTDVVLELFLASEVVNAIVIVLLVLLTSTLITGPETPTFVALSENENVSALAC